MPADIFISYSRKDSFRADPLVDRLRNEGYSIWIDQKDISGAEKWSAEIVDALEEAHTIILLVSVDSNTSVNVHREISIASEQGKHILPIDLEQVSLARELKYPLAGLQRLPITNVEAILKSLAKLGVPRQDLVASGGPLIPDSTPHGYAAPRTDDRKSLMVLPFADQSPEKDNGWFADGLMSELIAALSNVRSLRLIDQNTSLEYRGAKIKTAEIAKALNVRYFVEGSVRKFGEQIKVTMQLLDAELGEHLWTDSLRGEFKDIFDIQEEVARKVVDGLKLKLSADESKRIAGEASELRPTENIEAYELFLKARDNRYGNTATLKEAVAMLKRAIELDPKFVQAYSLITGFYFNLETELAGARELAREAIHKALAINPDWPGVYAGLAGLLIREKKYQEALDMAKKLTEVSIQKEFGYSWIGFCNEFLRDWKEAALNYERALALAPLDSHYVCHLVEIYGCAGDVAMIKRRIPEWLPLIESHLSRFPGARDQVCMRLALLLFRLPIEEWLLEVKGAEAHPDFIPANYFVLANYLVFVNRDMAVEFIRRAFEEGFRPEEQPVNPAPLSEIEEFAALRDMPEFQALVEAYDGSDVEKTSVAEKGRSSENA